MKQNVETKIAKSMNENQKTKLSETLVLDNNLANALNNDTNLYNEDNADNSFPKCKICFLFKNPIDSTCDLIAPCGCKGSIKYVHKTCLRLWRFKGKHIREIKKCEQCCCDYKVAEDLLPHLMVVRSTTAVSIVVAIFVAKCVINTGGEALAFLVDEEYFTEDIIFKSGSAGYRRYKDDERYGSTKQFRTQEKARTMQSDDKIATICRKPQSSKYLYEARNQGFREDQKFEDVLVAMRKKTADMQNAGYKYYEDSVSRLKKYLDNRIYKEKFAITLYTTMCLFLGTYAFFFRWSLLPVGNYMFTIMRVYQYGFWFDKLLLLAFNCWYLRKLYQDLFLYIDSCYIFLLNYNM